MALFSDGPISTLEDLQRHDSSLLDVVGVEQISLTGKLAVAQEEIWVEIRHFLRFRSPGDSGAYVKDNVRVCSSIQRWHTLRTLSLVYRDAYYSQLNDRYERKWRDLEKLALRAGATAFRSGIEIVSRPIPKAKTPLIELVQGAGAPGTYYVQVTSRNDTGDEGSPSEIVEVVVGPADSFTVRSSTSGPWNIYLGTSAESVHLQNAASLAEGETWTFQGAILAGRQPGSGQRADRVVRDSGALPRG